MNLDFDDAGDDSSDENFSMLIKLETFSLNFVNNSFLTKFCNYFLY